MSNFLGQTYRDIHKRIFCFNVVSSRQPLAN
jgi:hypothetical protein